jgi:DNA-binding transcriptional regulator LsrR (DeoR family)
MAVKNKISDLRDYLFEGMERLLDDNDKFGASEGVALAQMGKAIVDSAKAEIQAVKMMGGNKPLEFIGQTDFTPEPKQLTPKEFDKLGADSK